MSRPGRPKWKSAAEIETAIAAARTQFDLLARDLRDALIAGENTVSYRGAIAGLRAEIETLETALFDAQKADADRVRLAIEKNAREIAGECNRRHGALMDALLPPPTPSNIKELHA